MLRSSLRIFSTRLVVESSGTEKNAEAGHCGRTIVSGIAREGKARYHELPSLTFA
jgi:hypothetical protein